MNIAPTDRELLELAAKAFQLHPDFRWSEKLGCMASEDDVLGTPVVCRWAPLRDDGDALRLAVKVGLKIVHWPAAVEAHLPTGARECFAVRYDGDPCAATRRAIVLAAAAIGRAMP